MRWIVMSKQPTKSQSYHQLKRKRSRQIRSETNDPHLAKDTVLNVNGFLQSRKFEINELVKSQLNSKLASSSRVFQSLPRTLRRRTASHNVKRIPKRLRNRAIREMKKNENSFKITKKRLSSRQLYRLRTIRALLKLSARSNISKLHSTESNLRLGKLKIRQRIKKINSLLKLQENYRTLNNKVGSADHSATDALAPPALGKLKYMKRQQEFVWLSTHVWHAKRSHMMKRWGFQIPYKPTQKCFRLAHRNFHLSGGICWDQSYINTLVLESDCSDGESLKQLVKVITNRETLGSKFFANGAVNDVLIHKDEEVIGQATILSFRASNVMRVVMRLHPSIYEEAFNYLLKIKPDQVKVHDNRYSIGSISVTGPIALQSIATVLKPINYEAPESQILGKLATESNLPDKTIFTLLSHDPRLANRCKPRTPKDVNINDVLIDMKMNKTNINDVIIEQLLTSNGRTKSYENQLSLKDVEKVKKGNSKESSSGFPVIIYKNDNIYTILMPWYWVMPTWYQLNHIAHLNHGGTFQLHQYKFEQGKLFFPVDFPFTKQGQLENYMAAELKRGKWEKKPSSKKHNYYKMKIHTGNEEGDEPCRGEVGDPFGCDWRFLQLLKFGMSQLKKNEFGEQQQLRTSSWDPLTQDRKIEQLHDVYNFIKDAHESDKELVFLERNMDFNPVKFSNTPNTPSSIRDSLNITPINIEMPGRGSPTANARIYSIPPSEIDTWKKSLNMMKDTGKKNHDHLPTVPHSSRLIGFVTSGSFNLGKGFGTGVGAIDSGAVNNGEKFVVVRNVGEDFGRLGIWREIEL